MWTDETHDCFFDVGMDAQVAYGFHHLRDEKPWLARGRAANQVSPLEFATFSFSFEPLVGTALWLTILYSTLLIE
jgi:hypothetical protein